MGCGDRTTTLFSTTVITSTVTVHPVSFLTKRSLIVVDSYYRYHGFDDGIRENGFRSNCKLVLAGGSNTFECPSSTCDLRIHYIFIPQYSAYFKTYACQISFLNK
jgi:hypothetical protein